MARAPTKLMLVGNLQLGYVCKRCGAMAGAGHSCASTHGAPEPVVTHYGYGGLKVDYTAVKLFTENVEASCHRWRGGFKR